jgi:hypothetical protein
MFGGLDLGSVADVMIEAEQLIQIIFVRLAPLQQVFRHPTRLNRWHIRSVINFQGNHPSCQLGCGHGFGVPVYS